MKFENIKVGDEVLSPCFVSLGWRSFKRFMILEKVTRVTKTQFVVESGNRFQKDRGSIIGEKYYGNALFPNEGEDQTKEKEDFIYRLKMSNITNRLCRDMNDITEPNDPNLQKKYAFIKELKTLLDREREEKNDN